MKDELKRVIVEAMPDDTSSDIVTRVATAVEKMYAKRFHAAFLYANSTEMHALESLVLMDILRGKEKKK